MDYSNHSFIQIFLVIVLIFNHIERHKVSHIGTGVPANIVCVYVDLSKISNHLVLVYGIDLSSWSSGSKIRCRVAVMMTVRAGNVCGGEGKGVGNLKSALDIHADKKPGSSSRECLRAVLDNPHHHLIRIRTPCQLVNLRGPTSASI